MKLRAAGFIVGGENLLRTQHYVVGSSLFLKIRNQPDPACFPSRGCVRFDVQVETYGLENNVTYITTWTKAKNCRWFIFQQQNFGQVYVVGKNLILRMYVCHINFKLCNSQLRKSGLG